MYTPASFANHDQDQLHGFIDQHSFGVLVSSLDDEVVATHIPFLLDRDTGDHGTLIGHVAKANPQWKHIEGREILVIFNGPHAYVSPAWYEADNVVPTWNYVAVHVYGTVTLQQDRSSLMDIVRKTVDVYESNRTPPWSLDSVDADFADSLLDAIVGFTIEINRIEGKWKLNQNHTDERREKVAVALRETGGHEQRQVAKLMSDEQQ